MHARSAAAKLSTGRYGGVRLQCTLALDPEHQRPRFNSGPDMGMWYSPGMKRRLALVPVLLLACVAPASAQTQTPVQLTGHAATKLPACAHAGKRIAVPHAFPHQFPFPSGTVIDATKHLAKGQIGIYGFVPSHTFSATVNFFKILVPRHGFKVLNLEADFPHDSEGTYQGYGKVGRWQIRSIAGCPRAMTFAASVEASR